MKINVDVETKQFRIYRKPKRDDTLLFVWATRVSIDNSGNTYFWYLDEVITILPSYSELWAESCPEQEEIKPESTIEVITELDAQVTIKGTWSEADAEQAEVRLKR